MQLSVIDQSTEEPITLSDVKGFMGYPLSDESQNSIITRMITSARLWLEGRTALSLVSKGYKAYFEPDDADEGWYELPVSPVLDEPAITVKMNGTDTTFQKRGLTTIKIYPDKVFGTIAVGSSDSSYVTVTFQAGATSEMANTILLELVSIMFNNRDSGIGVSYSRLPFDLQQKINSISVNL